MPIARTGAVTRGLGALFADGVLAGLGDRELLELFRSQSGERAEAAFALLITRHGPMVHATCRRICRDPNDAVDSAQATFLVLVRSAGTVRVAESLGPWLHGVSVRVARRCRWRAQRRRLRERTGGEAPEPAAFDMGERRTELREVIDRELAALPLAYRSAIVLCDLEGLTHDEAAQQLGCPIGTVRSRLARGRDALRCRLVRRGFGPPAAAMVEALGRESTAAGAMVRDATFARMAQAAARLAAGRTLSGTVPARVISLVAGVSHAMKVTRFARILALGLVGVVGAAGIVALAADRRSEDRPLFAQKAPDSTKIRSKADRNDAAKTAFDAFHAVVVATVPAQCATDVDPATTEIRVTFSKDMVDGDYSLLPYSKRSAPEITGKPRYDAAQRTYFIPVKLQPGKAYGLWCNTERFGNFKDEGGDSAVPYLLLFRTGK